jgi:type II secretory ATPase GspE/PulE/Tfp pilus assembly ATPase PilB-like protein
MYMADATSLQDQLAKMRRQAEERDAKRRADSYQFPYLEPAKLSVNLEALDLISESQAKEGNVAAIAAKEMKVAIVAIDPKYSKTSQILEELQKKGYQTNIFVVSRSSFEYVLTFYRFVAKQREKISGKVHVDEETKKGEIPRKAFNTLAEAAAAIKSLNQPGKIPELLETVLSGALSNRASDIHFEPSEDTVRLRYRIDGNLNDIFAGFEHAVYHSLLSRIKLLSNLKLNIHDEPQDGRFTINLPGKDVEVRVAIAPSEFGEVVVMRLLDPEAINLSLQDLGLRDDDLKIAQEQLDRPYGMVLNTGPTGSGKTTTLYAFLRHKNTPDLKIITIEDPIEYHLEGIQQTQVNEEAGYTFAGGLRSLMRQDPDVILVGEIRDNETAEITIQAALTGHLVLSTVHANEAAGGIPRLLDLGVKTVSLAPALNLLIAQRLVRRLCQFCKTEEKINPELKGKIEKYVNALPGRVDKKKYLEGVKMFKPVGCDKCNNAGYKGRVGIYELLIITPQMQELIIKGAGQLAIQEEIKKTDFVSMQQDGVLKVTLGMTSFEEVEAVTGKIVW